MTNLPPGVNGNEWAIAGPDYEREVSGGCTVIISDSMGPVRQCIEDIVEYGFRGERWHQCGAGHVTSLPAVEADPDAGRD